MAHALVVEGMDIFTRQEMEDVMERLGHEMRAELDEQYKRETWGLRPEDVAEIQALTGDAKRWSPP